LAFGKIAAASLSIGIGESSGLFTPSLFAGIISGMAFGDIVHHLLGAAAGQPSLYAVMAMGAVFASAARGAADLAGQRGGDDRQLLRGVKVPLARSASRSNRSCSKTRWVMTTMVLRRARRSPTRSEKRRSEATDVVLAPSELPRNRK